jgi:hypothetical protein
MQNLPQTPTHSSSNLQSPCPTIFSENHLLEISWKVKASGKKIATKEIRYESDESRAQSEKQESRTRKTLIKLCRRVCVVLIKTDSFLACAHRVHLRECFEEEVRCQIATNQKPSNRSSFNFITIFFLLSFPDLRLPHHHHHYSNNRSIHAGQRRKRSRSRTTNVLVM